MTKLTQAPFITPGVGTGIVVTEASAIARVHYDDLVQQLSNSVQGIQGAQGSSTGDTGAQGIQGIQGARGSQGITGRTGSQGAQGISGSAVAQGAQGRQGTQGGQGTQGAGVQGTQGRQGLSGSAVAQGSQGAQGNNGSQGITGTGIQGTQGVQGNIGPIGGSANQVVYKNSSNIASGSSNLIFDGSVLSAYLMVSTRQSGSSGGYIQLNVPESGHTLGGTGVAIDIYNNLFRVYENGGTNRGGYIDITTLDAGATTNLLGLGVGQAWSINLASGSGSGDRLPSTSYRNISGQPISASISASLAGSYLTLEYSTNNTNWITLDQVYGAGGATGGTVNAVIPDQGYYKITVGSGPGIVSWYELR